MKKVIAGFALLLSFTSTSYADCWMQCMKSPFGGCMGKVKMCNVTDTDNALDSLTHDIGGAYENIRNEWVALYGRLPDEIQLVLDRYPLTIAMLVVPGTHEYALLTGALEAYVVRAKSRAHDIEPLVKAEEWRSQAAKSGYGLITIAGGIDFSNTDWTNPADAPVADRFDGVWSKFLSCLTVADDLTNGNMCLDSLRLGILNVSL